LEEVTGSVKERGTAEFEVRVGSVGSEAEREKKSSVGARCRSLGSVRLPGGGKFTSTSTVVRPKRVEEEDLSVVLDSLVETGLAAAAETGCSHECSSFDSCVVALVVVVGLEVVLLGFVSFVPTTGESDDGEDEIAVDNDGSVTGFLVLACGLVVGMGCTTTALAETSGVMVFVGDDGFDVDDLTRCCASASSSTCAACCSIMVIWGR